MDGELHDGVVVDAGPEDPPPLLYLPLYLLCSLSDLHNIWWSHQARPIFTDKIVILDYYPDCLNIA